jgi:hypothetical protein
MYNYSLKISWLLTILWVALGYFVYVAILVSLIPFVGVVYQGLIMNYLIVPWTFGVTGITATLLTGAMFFGLIIKAFLKE